jgi:phosphatidylglycerol lysyltransferase
MGPRWIFTVGAVLLVDFWIALLTYRQVPFGGETWWRFALDGDGPRSLRAAVGASVVLLLWAVAHLISGVAPAAPRR